MSDTRTRRRLDPAERRRQIAAAAAAVFATADPSDVSFEDVASAAGVSRSLVYKYFGDRGNLLAAAYLHEVDQLDGEIRLATAECESDAERLRAVVTAYLRFARSHTEASRLIASLGTLRHPAVQAAMSDRIERIAAQFGSSDAARVLARGVVGLLEAAASYWLDHGDPDGDDLGELIFTLLWSGIPEAAAAVDESSASSLGVAG